MKSKMKVTIKGQEDVKLDRNPELNTKLNFLESRHIWSHKTIKINKDEVLNLINDERNFKNNIQKTSLNNSLLMSSKNELTMSISKLRMKLEVDNPLLKRKFFKFQG